MVGAFADERAHRVGGDHDLESASLAARVLPYQSESSTSWPTSLSSGTFISYRTEAISVHKSNRAVYAIS